MSSPPSPGRFRLNWKRPPAPIPVMCRLPDASSAAPAPPPTSAFPSGKDLLESPRSDPHGFERVIGESDLLSINFLDRGKRAAATVCRIKVPSDGGAWYGTGFLVGPRLLLTNHHVLSNADEASQSEAEFGYEHDLDGVLLEPVRFNLRPHEIFYSNAELDITFV